MCGQQGNPYVNGCYVYREMVLAILREGLSLRQALLAHQDAYCNAGEQARPVVNSEGDLVICSYCSIEGKRVEVQTRVSDMKTFVRLVQGNVAPCLADSDMLLELGDMHISRKTVNGLLESHRDFLTAILQRHAGGQRQPCALGDIESFTLLNSDSVYISGHTVRNRKEIVVFVATRLKSPFTTILLREEYEQFARLVQRRKGASPIGFCQENAVLHIN